MKFRTFLIRLTTLALVFSAGMPQGAFPETEEIRLTGDHVASITYMFLRNHYSKLTFDDEHSREMLQIFLDRLDPTHHYFLQGDVDEFRKEQDKLDDQVRRGNIELAFTIFQRFSKRMEERLAFVNKIIDEKLDPAPSEKIDLERKKAPYPASTAEAEGLWRTRIKFEILELTLSGESEAMAKDRIRKRYRSIHFRYENFKPNDVVSTYLNSFTGTYDPHSSYLPQDELENFNISMRLSLEGIGATLRWEDGYTIISAIVPGGAADREGTLQPEDKIISVAQGSEGAMEDVTSMRLSDVVKLIRGERGTLVRLAYLRKDKTGIEKRREVTITRDKIILKDGEAAGRVLENKHEEGKTYKMGIIELPSFYVDFTGRQRNPENFKSASRDVKKLLEDFMKQHVDGVVLDLRNNGGGGLDEAVALAGLFLPSGPMVVVKDLRGKLSPINNPFRKPVYTGPLVVLINKFSASASEIVAGALQDYERAVVIGDKSTFGKGTVQNIIHLSEGLGALKTTVAKFYRPGSASTQNRGVESDVVLPSLNNHMELGESSLENAMPWDTIQRQNYRRWSDLDPLLPVLRERSRHRVSNDTYFKEVNSDIEEYLKVRKGRKEVTAGQLIAEHEKAAKEQKDEKKPSHGKKEGQEDLPDKVLEETMNILSDFIRMGGGQQAVAG
ncbi:MAG: carboxy terminal-processing peptidase [Deltaproteobacteria bacterium]|nr:carboxy terminal-processing peptidase [Deltaproteobacteria bacterium]